ncbi:hypothetical protein PanWU01x14_055400, partial [Parasponia andersonii]
MEILSWLNRSAVESFGGFAFRQEETMNSEEGQCLILGGCWLTRAGVWATIRRGWPLNEQWLWA